MYIIYIYIYIHRYIHLVTHTSIHNVYDVYIYIYIGTCTIVLWLMKMLWCSATSCLAGYSYEGQWENDSRHGFLPKSCIEAFDTAYTMSWYIKNETC